MPNHWIREPEPSPHQKEVQKLKAKVKVLEASQPEIDVSLSCCDERVLNITKVTDISNNDKHRINAQILRNNPPAARASSMLMSSYMDDHGYMDRYKEFKEVTVPSFVADLPANLQRVYNQFPMSLSLRNIGDVQAEKLIVRIELYNALAHKKWTVLGNQPLAPKPRDPLRSIIRPHYFPNINNISYPVGRHELDIEFNREVISIECEDFRHGTNENIEFILTPDVGEQPVIVSVRATASNLKGEVVKEYVFQKEMEVVNVDDLLDFENTCFRKERPMEKEIEESVESEDFDRLYLLSYKVDED